MDFDNLFFNIYLFIIFLILYIRTVQKLSALKKWEKIFMERNELKTHISSLFHCTFFQGGGVMMPNYEYATYGLETNSPAPLLIRHFEQLYILSILDNPK